MLSPDPPSVTRCTTTGTRSSGKAADRRRERGHHCPRRLAGQRRRTSATPRKGSALGLAFQSWKRSPGRARGVEATSLGMSGQRRCLQAPRSERGTQDERHLRVARALMSGPPSQPGLLTGTKVLESRRRALRPPRRRQGRQPSTNTSVWVRWDGSELEPLRWDGRCSGVA